MYCRIGSFLQEKNYISEIEKVIIPKMSSGIYYKMLLLMTQVYINKYL